MRLLGQFTWKTFLVQSLTVFLLFVALGLVLLAVVILLRRSRARGGPPSLPPPNPPISSSGRGTQSGGSTFRKT
jgi:hypothetical protein